MKLYISAVVALVAPLAAQTTTLAGVSSEGAIPDREARLPALSADGQFVAFDSNATNLAVGDTNDTHDVFVHVLATGSTDLVSISLAGVPGNGQSTDSCISGNGRFVAFESSASDLVAGDTNERRDVFVRDLWLSTTAPVSVSGGGSLGNGDSRGASISSNGRFVAFSSMSSNLVAGDSNAVEDVFVHDRRTGETWRASTSSLGLQGSAASYEAALSADGMHLAFTSAAPEFVPGDTNGQPDIFVRDLGSGAVLRTSVGPSGLQADGESGTPVLSLGGAVVAFRSSASNLVLGDTNGQPDVFAHDMATQQTVRVSVTSSGAQADRGSLPPSISADGSRVAFMSFATNMGLPPGMDEVYVRDIAAGFTEQISVSTLGEGAQYFSNFPSISADGRFVAFMSLAQNLIPNPTPYQLKVFVRDRLGCSPTIATYCTASSTSIPGCFASIVALGTPSLSAPQSFEVVSDPVPGGTLGVACVGVVGPDDLPIGSQGGLLCVSSFQRSIGLLTGGNPGACEGELRLTLADLVATEPALVEPSGMAWVQFWFRDPASADGFGLSNALWFQTCP